VMHLFEGGRQGTVQADPAGWAPAVVEGAPHERVLEIVSFDISPDRGN